VPLDEFTRHTLLRYVRNLRDTLTATKENPEGDFLKVLPLPHAASIACCVHCLLLHAACKFQLLPVSPVLAPIAWYARSGIATIEEELSAILPGSRIHECGASITHCTFSEAKRG
jgi:hypothetical protein